MSINDGTSQKNLQVLYDTNHYFSYESEVSALKDKIEKLSVGASVELRGILVKPTKILERNCRTSYYRYSSYGNCPR